jgi:hypothetical protein
MQLLAVVPSKPHTPLIDTTRIPNFIGLHIRMRVISSSLLFQPRLFKGFKFALHVGRILKRLSLFKKYQR